MKTNQRHSVGSLAIACILLATPAVLRAGANAWTGSRPFGAQIETADLVAADPLDPYVVYAVFQPDLYRSGDGGRSWERLASFDQIYSLLVHPASPSTLYLGAVKSGGLAGIFKSADSGLTWTQFPLSATHEFVWSLVGDRTDPSTVYAGTGSGQVYKTTDSGAHWSSGSSFLQGAIASLVIDPHNDNILFSGSEADYYYFQFGAFGWSNDGGTTWHDLTPEPIGTVSALVIDPASTLYIGLGTSFSETSLRGVLQWEDPFSYSQVNSGLPEDVNVTSLAIDPLNPGTLYAGTTSGVYRTRDSGANWTPFGQQLAGVPTQSLAFGGDGRFLHAAAPRGAFELEIASGPLDVASGATGESRVLFWDADRLAVGTLDASGNWTSTPFEGPSLIWTATAIAGGADGLARVLWLSGDGRSGLEIVSLAGRHANFVFASLTGWMPTDVAVDAGGTARLLWTSAAGGMFLSSVDSSGASTRGPEYGPARGWSAVAVAEAPGGGAWVLWRCTDGRSGISLHGASGVMDGSLQWAADSESAAEDIALGGDGRLRLLRTSRDGKAQVWTVNSAGLLSDGQSYENPGFTPRRIAAGADGRTRVLWNASGGGGEVWLLHPDNTVESRHGTPGAGYRPPTPPPGGVHGEWTGTFVPADFIDCDTNPSPAQAVFNQNGSAVTGTLDTGSNACGFSNARFEGTFHGNLLSGTVTGHRFTGGSTASGHLDNGRLVLTVVNANGFPMAIPGGEMRLTQHR